ncbi:MAG TPA: DUF5667 domain-containing protein [Jatrophihabitans sp.]|nr:DUF5667 domain-containing protein [Jatrophihabitans sp.]
MHRISMPRLLRRYPEPAESADPRIRELVSELADLRIAPDPDPRFRAELRTQLVAIAPRLVAEGRTRPGPTATARVDSPTPATSRRATGAKHTDDPLARRGIGWRRPLAATACVLVVLGLALGVAVWLSRSALPGDSLYGLKRASERVQLFFASSDTDRAKDYLQFARRRATEVNALLHRDSASAVGSAGSRPSAAALSPQTTKLIAQTLNSADADTAAAMRLLGGQVARDKSAKPLDPMKVWAPRQLKRLQGIAAAAPSAAVKARADASVNTLVQVWTRTLALLKTAQCACTGSAGSDTLGPMPCTPCAAPAKPGGSTGSGGPTTPAPSSSTTRRHGTGGGGSPVTSAGGGTAGGSGGGATGGSGGTARTGAPGSNAPTSAARSSGAAPAPGSSSGPGQPPVRLPTLPLPSLSNPLSNVNSCHVSIAAGPLHIAITVCPSASP